MNDFKQTPSQYLKNRLHQQSSGITTNPLNFATSGVTRGMLMNPVSESIEYHPQSTMPISTGK